MIEGLRPYAEYKDSGQAWLGRVPTHWDVRRTKLILSEVDSRSNTGKEQLLRVSQYTGVTQRKAAGGSDAPNTRAFSLVGYKRVARNDLVINIMLAWNGSMGVSRFDGIASPAYCVYRLNKGAEPWYFHELFRLPLYKGRIKAVSTGVVESRLRLYSDDLGRIEALLPPPEEQAAIVRFLDHANRKFDGFIGAKRKLIGLLNEQRQAIIHRAVTRGVCEDVPLRPSGILSLGDIPRHWEVVPLKSVCSVQSGITLGKTYANQGMKEVPYLRVANVQAGHLSLDNVKTLRLPPSEVKRSMLQVGDVLMTEGGDPDKLGRGCVWNAEIAECVHQNHVFAVRPLKMKMRPQYLAALLESHYAKLYFIRTAKQTTNLASTNKTTIGQFRLLVPPIDEQDSILAGLASELEPVVSAITRTEREIALMQEYRTRLTSDLVTGKLDVWNTVVPNEDALADEALASDEDFDATDEEELALTGGDD